MEIETKLSELGLTLPVSAPPMARYSPVVIHNRVAYVSGQLPREGDRVIVTGAVGRDVSINDARIAARLCILRCLAVLKAGVGSLDNIEKIIKLSVFVQSAPGFSEQSAVADGASELIYDLFSPAGAHARSAIGVAQLPKNASVEIELLAAVSSEIAET